MTHELLTDLYEFSMANGYYQTQPHDMRARFDMFYRTVPDHGSFVLAAGLQQVIEEVKNWHFTQDDIDYMKTLNLFAPDFLNYLLKAKNECNIKAVREGTPIFPREPILTVEGPLMEAQMLETLILNIINHQSLIATKARRITQAAQGRPVMEFGARRAQGPDAATYGARAAVIGGCTSTSNVLAAKEFSIPAAGTMAHAWVESFPDELTAFKAWAKIYPDNASLLVDTFDVLQSGVPNAIKVFKELKKNGHKPVGIRIDSGDIAQLAAGAREQLDAAGFKDVKITASNALDEYVVKSLLEEGAPLDNFGIGEKLITSSTSPVLSGVYKLSALKVKGKWLPKIKISNTKAKTTLPSEKQVYRLYHNGKAFADIIALADEKIPEKIRVVNSDPNATHSEVELKNFEARPLLEPVLVPGKEIPVESDVFKIQAVAKAKVTELPAATKRFTNPDLYPVYLTAKLASLQKQLIDEHNAAF